MSVLEVFQLQSTFFFFITQKKKEPFSSFSLFFVVPGVQTRNIAGYYLDYRTKTNLNPIKSSMAVRPFRFVLAGVNFANNQSQLNRAKEGLAMKPLLTNQNSLEFFHF